MPSIFIQDDTIRRAKKGISYDFLAPDGSENRDAADVIYARFKEFNMGIPSSDDYLDFKLSVEALSGGTNTVILDDRGLPSVMVLLPKMDSANLSNGLESRVHPGFVVDNKGDLGVRLRRAYQGRNHAALVTIAEVDFPSVRHCLKEFATAFRQLWLRENKPFGLEVQEQRLGGLMYRMEVCEGRLKAYLDGEIDKIDELEERSLTKFKGYEGEAVAQNNWSATVTTSII